MPVGPQPPLVALVPVGDLALHFLAKDIYLRAEELDLPVRLAASYIGWAQDGAVCAVRPIAHRYRLGSYRAIPGVGITDPAVINDPLLKAWHNMASLFQLGDTEAMSVELGYKPNRGGGPQGIAGTRHYLLSDLRRAERGGTTLKELTTA